MKINESLICPKCNGKNFEIKHESTYLYTYKIDTVNGSIDGEGTENLPFLFDNREQVTNIEYLQCDKCSTMYTCDLAKDNSNIKLTILQKAIRCDHVDTPTYLG